MILAGLGSAALLGGAYMFQALGYAPCQMCLWQRWPHMVAIALGVLALFFARLPVAIAGALAALTTAVIGVYHTGVERDWWEGPSSCSGGGDITGLTGADLLSTDVLDKVVMCDEVSWALFGLSMPSWNALFSFLLAAIWILAARQCLKESRP
ncbi:Disulfide bond formation protein DsbB [Palleronia pelagia]|uniref:Disulfide bond formation protein DsbB n=2 Tax=Palleronia pelagia TaxID=387096 RepID=A0A1H8BX52_9RHOB|nr:Disulfide bond formation protein DsbB [Palleronia pelagia]